eukprot:gene14412-16552_t
MISTRKANLPAYIVGSAFYNSLSSDDNEEFCVPEENLKLTPSVENVDELSHLLNTLQYWGVTIYPGGLIAFLSSVHSAQYQEEVMRVMVRYESSSELLPLYTALQNLVSKSKRSFADRRSVTIVVPLLYGENEEVVKLSAAILGDVAAFCSGNRDCVFGSINFPRLFRRMQSITEETTLRELAIFLSKLCCLPTRSLYIVSPVLPLLTYLLTQSDEILLTQTCKALGSICDNNSECIKAVMGMMVAPRVIELTKCDSERINLAALFLVGTLTSQYSEHIQVFLDLDLLPILLPMTTRANTGRHIAWIVHNIASGSATQFQAVLDSGLLPGVANGLLSVNDAARMQAEATVSKVVGRSNIKQTLQLVEANIVPILCQLMLEEHSTSYGHNYLGIILRKVRFCNPNLLQVLLQQVFEICGSEELNFFTKSLGVFYLNS